MYGSQGLSGKRLSYQPTPSHADFLKRGKGKGGSPTRYDINKSDDGLKFKERRGTIVRRRGPSADYSYSMIGDESTLQLHN